MIIYFEGPHCNSGCPFLRISMRVASKGPMRTIFSATCTLDGRKEEEGLPALNIKPRVTGMPGTVLPGKDCPFEQCIGSFEIARKNP